MANCRQGEVVDCRDYLRYQTKRRRDSALLGIGIDPETSHSGNCIGVVPLLLLQKKLFLVRLHGLHHQLRRRSRVKSDFIFDKT